MHVQNSLVLGAALVWFASGGHGAPKNFIYIVPDGYGVASQTLARDYIAMVNGGSTAEHPMSPQIGADPLVIGSVRTQSLDDFITDSAASATAFSCGIKTYNGAIAVDNDGMPVGSVLEAAHLDGYKTGLVVTSRISHATPACYAAHVLQRGSENTIAAQEVGHSHPLGSVVDLLMGGGRRHFLPADSGGMRDDGLDLIEWAEGEGFTYVADKDGLDAALDGNDTVPLPFLGLFASSHMSYELDRDPSKEPSLLEMVKVALATLEKASEDGEGFFIMIEASRIDHAGHANDGPGHIHDTLMYNDVMSYAKGYIDANPNTWLLSAADHECGGLTLVDGYNPAVLAKSTKTSEYILRLLADYDGDDRAGYLKNELLPMYGLTDVTDEEIDMLLADVGNIPMSIGNMIAADAGIYWSTSYHTAADVLLYGYANGDAYSEMREKISGNRDNTELPGYVAECLGLDLDKATAALREDGVDWIEKRDQLDVIKREVKIHAYNHVH